ncbi:hypothetical protein ACFFGH_24915 [Lysobacter korlensis]|uniref:Uncharacterized protein n=1 Tax=Lysobacter korlensis TaxID=553636 RepID=A0ABV6RYU8_9GAMM
MVTLTGCVAAAPAQPSASTSEPRVSVALVQNRSDAPVRRLQLRVTNESAEELRIRTATLESTALAAPAVWEKGTTVPAGATRDLPVQFPGASCADGEPQTVVRMEVETAAGPATVEVPPADPNERMPLLTETDCFAQDVAAAGRVSLAGLRVGDPSEPAKLEVRVESAGGDTDLRVDSMESTVLFNPLDASGAPSASGEVGLELRGGDAEATALVPIVPNRCDPHALAEDKVGTLFVFAAEVEGGRSGELRLQASPELRADLYEYFTRACGL